MASEAARAPGAVGPKIMVTAQLPPAATVLPQVLAVMLKSPGFAPVIVTPEIVKVAVPVLVMVTDCPLPAVPTFWKE